MLTGSSPHELGPKLGGSKPTGWKPRAGWLARERGLGASRPLLSFPALSFPEPGASPPMPRGRTIRREDVSPYLSSRRKRALDLGLALLLLALLLPLMLQIALLIKLTSRGPAIYRQERGGRDHRPFPVLKFRTMYTTHNKAGGFPAQACRGDRRVTPVGRWLRQLSFDELPQLVNVVMGEMALVGPRPHALGHDLYYLGHVAGYAGRSACTPGLTGLAQVCGARGETAHPSAMQRRVALDLHYIRHASLSYDLLILWRTASLLFRCPDAY